MKVWLGVIAVFLSVALFQGRVFSANVKTFRNDELGFQITYPENWVQAQGKSALYIKRNSEKEPADMSINVSHFTGDKDSVMSEIKANPEVLMAQVKKRFPDAKLVESGETYLGGYPGYYLMMDYTIKNFKTEKDIKVFQIFCIKDKKFYLIHFETFASIYDITFPEFEKTLSSFNFR